MNQDVIMGDGSSEDTERPKFDTAGWFWRRRLAGWYIVGFAVLVAAVALVEQWLKGR